MREPDPKRDRNLRPAYLYSYTGENPLLLELRAMFKAKGATIGATAHTAGVCRSTLANHLKKNKVRSPKVDTLLSEILALGGRGIDAKTKKII